MNRPLQTPTPRVRIVGGATTWIIRAEVITKKRSDHEIFITKIYIHVIFSNFTKILNHENLELPYSRKIWRELNLADWPQPAWTKILANFNLAVRYGIAIRIYASKKFWRILIWRLQRQTAKPPNLIPRQIFRLYGIPQILVQLEIFAWRNSCPALIGKMFHPTDIWFRVNDYIQPMAIFTAWAKCIPLNIPITQR